LLSKPLAALPALLLVIVALWETCATRRDATAVPTDDAWARAGEVVRASYRAGDLVVFAPDWIDPVGRLHLGDLISVDDAARMDAAKFGRIWELAIRGARARDTEGLAPAETFDIDGIAIRRYERTPAIVVADIRDHLAEARQDGGRATIELAEVGFAPHRCIQVVPSPGHSVRVTFPALALGSELVGYVGLADVFTRRDIRAPGRLALEVAGREVVSVAPGIDDGWVRFAVPTQSGPTEVAFVASADAPQRQICFAAEARL
jgi:hypothetical protein